MHWASTPLINSCSHLSGNSSEISPATLTAYAQSQSSENPTRRIHQVFSSQTGYMESEIRFYYDRFFRNIQYLCSIYWKQEVATDREDPMSSSQGEEWKITVENSVSGLKNTDSLGINCRLRNCFTDRVVLRIIASLGFSTLSCWKWHSNTNRGMQSHGVPCCIPPFRDSDSDGCSFNYEWKSLMKSDLQCRIVANESCWNNSLRRFIVEVDIAGTEIVQTADLSSSPA